MRARVSIFSTKQRVELYPRHVRLRDVRHVASRTLGDGGLLSGFRVRQRVMTKGEETPAIGVMETPAVFYSDVNAVEFTVKKASAGRLRSGSVWKNRLQNQRQFFECVVRQQVGIEYSRESESVPRFRRIVFERE
jgi:hypothetical protein